jgi:hypothetical protein
VFVDLSLDSHFLGIVNGERDPAALFRTRVYV